MNLKKESHWRCFSQMLFNDSLISKRIYIIDAKLSKCISYRNGKLDAGEASFCVKKMTQIQSLRTNEQSILQNLNIVF